MEYSAVMETNTIDTENNQAEKKHIGALLILAAVPALIGAWSAACLVGMIVSYVGPSTWHLFS